MLHARWLVTVALGRQSADLVAKDSTGFGVTEGKEGEDQAEGEDGFWRKKKIWKFKLTRMTF